MRTKRTRVDREWRRLARETGTKRRMKAPVRVTASTHKPGGRPVRMNVTVRGVDPESAVLDALERRRDRGRWFVGDIVSVRGADGRTKTYVLEEEFGERVLLPWKKPRR